MVKIDKRVCSGPKKCGICVSSCSNGVFIVVPVGKRIYGKEPKHYEIKPYFSNLCNDCGECVKKCPVKGCIKLE